MLPPKVPASSALNGPTLGEKIDGAIAACTLVPPSPSRDAANDAASVALGQSMRTAGASDAPVERMLSAYHTPVPERSTLDVTRCAGRDDASSTTAAQDDRSLTRYEPTVTIELRVSNSSALAGANGSASHRFPSTMNAYS